ncbi:uncharacterized protein LOC143296679 [Babylonia areolata]|uniref:uncharacterized protein LOC143296679 n=1 Tax=Babylonia areolata TaxID=304850 RepID=UPI003FD16070
MLVLFQGTAASSPLTNVALHKPAAQSSVDPEFPSLTADKAVDGNQNTFVSECQHTERPASPQPQWWLVDLQAFHEITSVTITNRGDCCGWRLHDFDIQVFMVNPIKTVNARIHLCYHYIGAMADGAVENLQCHQPVRGRYVRINMDLSNEPINICEVAVWARLASPATISLFMRTPGRQAEGTVLGEVMTHHPFNCLTSCMSDVTCSAVNVGPETLTSAGWSHVCQLLAFGGIGQPDTTVPDHGWTFYSITADMAAYVMEKQTQSLEEAVPSAEVYFMAHRGGGKFLQPVGLGGNASAGWDKSKKSLVSDCHLTGRQLEVSMAEKDIKRHCPLWLG